MLMLTPAHRSWVDFEFQAFQDVYKPVLFKNVDFGLAGNIWAEMMAVGGWGGLILFLIVLLTGVSILNYLFFCSRNPLLVALISFLAFYVAFYIQRSDLAFLLSRMRIVVVCALIIAFFSKLVLEAARCRRVPAAKDGQR
jgi:hypothetical protein